MLFKLNVVEKNVHDPANSTYRIKKVCFDDSVITAFTEHYKLNENHNNGGHSPSVNDYNGGPTISSKDFSSLSENNDCCCCIIMDKKRTSRKLLKSCNLYDVPIGYSIEEFDANIVQNSVGHVTFAHTRSLHDVSISEVQSNNMDDVRSASVRRKGVLKENEVSRKFHIKENDNGLKCSIQDIANVKGKGIPPDSIGMQRDPFSWNSNITPTPMSCVLTDISNAVDYIINNKTFPKLKRKMPIHGDCSDSEYVSNDDNSDDSADYDDYDDLGDQSCVCQSCGAIMWYGERLARHYETESPKFSLCCMNGKVQLPKLKDPPTILSSLLFSRDRRSRNFQDNIRSLLPEEGTTPKFAQLYIFDTENEVQNRIAAVRSGNNSNNLDLSIESLIKDMIDVSNVLARSYRVARDRIAADGNRGVKLRLVKSRSTDGWTYNLPNASEIAALIVGDFDNQEGVRDIVVETQSKRLQRISELHPLYPPLQYRLIFPYGEDGYRDDIPLRESSSNSSRKRRFNQDKLRVDMYKGLRKMIVKGDGEGTSAGMCIVLPSTFTNGPRYMFNNFMDALQICNWIGFPSLFITITCNPKWPEIQRVLRDTNLRPEDRPDILCRVFKMKLDSLISDFKKGHIFGRIRSYVCTIEFQKRGLPHAHILLWLHNDDKPKCSEDIDRITCAEIPDKTCDRKMYKLVKKYMIHGPCGHANMNSPCMNDGICTKRFPKIFLQRTEADDEGYHSYRRREDGRTVTKKKTILDNGYVVPYNRALLLKYIELCNQNKPIKYLFKYVNKGNDRVTAAFYQSRNTNDGEQIRDEIKMYYDCRYLSACEASWRLFGFDIHYRDPPR
ncbi:PREDICTED: uncharacterized protein LOC105973150 [Erythranthe guttata]|uniref:uncharacterized protein LOC105973150 n=1 Tax=Erythranthe guttata TaxID=4155 RepID=UPI00064DDFA0|nr:PREDICTED: uncharacterized protein LOC105973150 [Erythranthe guttata]|eukprot:XP_012853624.1 PREDICTED: uncharacterized protein LOC105973150 [Erythranthe guttata]